MIKKENFDRFKKFDRVTDAGGYTNGLTWKVVGVFEDSKRGKVVTLACESSLKKNGLRSCRWSEEKNGMVDSITREIIPDFQGEFAYVHEESVSQIVEEMLANRRFSQEEADRLLAASRNDRSLATHSA